MKLHRKAYVLLVLLLWTGVTGGCYGTWGTAVEIQEQIAEPESPEQIAELESSEQITELESPEQETELKKETDGEKEDCSVSVVMVGDILLHTPLAKSALRENGEYDFTAVFANVEEEIAEADLALVNQEVIIGGADLGISGYPVFNAPYELGDALVQTGFDVICHATNHSLDKGKKGLVRCMEFWRTTYPQLAVVGINETAEAQENICIYEQNGMRIAILNYTYGTNGISLPEDMPYGVNLLEEKRVKEDLQKAEKEADFTIVCPHWGTEYSLEVSAQQEKWARFFLENGADLVLGTHPHVIEPVEWVRDEKSGKEMLVYYSLGNFVNWTSGTGEGVANRMVGGMAEITLKKSEDGIVYIYDYGIKALVCHVTTGQDGVTVYPLSDYTQEMGQQNEIIAQDASFSAMYCEELCNQVWGELWE